MATKPKDTFFDNYAFGTIASPEKIDTDELLTWFRDHDIIAGVAPVDTDCYKFYVPMLQAPDSDKTLIGVVTPDGDLDFKLLASQLTFDLAKKFSANVFIDDDGDDFADFLAVVFLQEMPGVPDHGQRFGFREQHLDRVTDRIEGQGRVVVCPEQQ